MANVDGVRAAILRFMETMPLDTTAALLLTAGELAVLHLSLEILQDMMERHTTEVYALAEFGSLRKKVEDVLSQAGYGGDARPG